MEQITALLDNKRVLAPEKDILEVKNAIATYEQIATFELYSLTSLCNAHQLLMNRLIKNAGQIRNTEVGIVKGKEIAHITPPAQ